MKVWYMKGSHLLTKMMLKVVSACLTTHAKRIFFLTTLFMQLTKLQSYQEAEMVRFNQSLKVVRSEKALQLPSAIHNLIWNQESLKKTLDDICGDDMYCEHRNTVATVMACRQIVSQTPNWLRYGRQDDMVKDLLRLVKTSREIVHPQLA